MPWPYCPNCQAAHKQFLMMVRDADGNPLAWACSNCQHWIRTVERIGDDAVTAEMAAYGVEFIPADTVIEDPTLGTRYSCGNTCDLVLRDGAASCSCGQDGQPQPLTPAAELRPALTLGLSATAEAEVVKADAGEGR